MARRLIGVGITDAQGNVAISYTGTGAGELQIVAEHDELTSNTYDLWDLLFYDSGFESSEALTAKWTLGSKVTRTSDDNGTKLTINGAGLSTFYQYTNTTFTGDFECVFYVEHDDAVAVRFGVISGSTRGYGAVYGSQYLKLRRENGATTYYSSSDGETWTQTTTRGTEPSSSTVSIFIGIYQQASTDVSLIYRDLKVYSI